MVSSAIWNKTCTSVFFEDDKKPGKLTRVCFFKLDDKTHALLLINDIHENITVFDNNYTYSCTWTVYKLSLLGLQTFSAYVLLVFNKVVKLT